MTPPVPIPTTGGISAKLTSVPSSFVNIRSDPTGGDIGDLMPNDEVVYYPDAPADGWVYIEPVIGKLMPRPAGYQGAKKGWVSLQAGAVVFTPTVTPPPAPQPLTLTAQQYADLTAANATITRILQEVKPPVSGGGF